MVKHLRMTYISRVAIPVEIEYRVRSGTSATSRPLLSFFVEERLVLLHVSYGGFRWRLRCAQGRVTRGTWWFKHLLAPSMSTTHRCLSISWCILWKSVIFGYLDILVPITVCEIQSVFHPWFELVPQFYASVKLSFVPFYVSCVEARGNCVLQAALFLLRLSLLFIITILSIPLLNSRTDISFRVEPLSRACI